MLVGTMGKGTLDGQKRQNQIASDQRGRGGFQTLLNGRHEGRFMSPVYSNLPAWWQWPCYEFH